MLKELRDFIMRGNVVDLAVAVVLGAAFGALVTGFVASFITPLIALIGGKADFGDLVFTISDTRFTYGEFLNLLISFLIIAAVVFFLIVKPVNAMLARLKRGEEPEVEAPPQDVVLLMEIRDLLRDGGGQPSTGTPSRPT
jgi:large conductance mechanosensitive channel